MKYMLTAALAASMTAALGAAAFSQPYGQPYGAPPQNGAMRGGSMQAGPMQGQGMQSGGMQYGYGRDFWRGSPDSAHERLDWLQERLDRGMQDGSITRSEAMRVGHMLRQTRRVEARLMMRDHGQLSSRDGEYMQRRLDNMSRQIHWARNNGVDQGAPG